MTVDLSKADKGPKHIKMKDKIMKKSKTKISSLNKTDLRNSRDTYDGSKRTNSNKVDPYADSGGF
jgi:hypothetical protein